MKRRLLLFGPLVLLAAPVTAERLFTSGFETNSSAATQEWTSIGVSPTFVTTPVHSGTYAIEINASQENTMRSFATSYTSGTLHFRCYIRFSSFPGDGVDLCADSSSSGGLGAVVQTDLNAGNTRFECFNAVASTTATDTTTLSADTWYRVEVEHVISDTTGSISCKLYEGDNTTEWATLTPTSSGDTLPTNINRLYVGVTPVVATPGTIYYDDVAVNDTVGSSQNSWTGPGKVALLEPDSDVSGPWTTTGTCTGGDFGCVNELPGATDDTNYISSGTTINTIERLGLTAISGPDADDDIILIQIFGHLGGSGTTGTRQVRLKFWDEAGNPFNGATCSGSTLCCDVSGFATAPLPTDILMVRDAGSKVASDVNNFDIGVENMSAHDCRASILWANVEWIDFVPAALPPGSLMMMGVGR